MAEEIVKKRRARIKVTPVEVPVAEPIVEETNTIATPSIPVTEESTSKENVESTENETNDSLQNTTSGEILSAEKQEETIANLPQPVIQAVEDSKYIPNDKEKELLNIKTFIELNEYINEGRENENIVQVGKYSTLPTDGIIYVFIHNREGEIPACMKNEKGRTLNLSTGKEDQITNYKGCGAIWIRFK